MGAALTGNRSKRVLLSGLDAAGKTTIVYKLELDDMVTTIPSCMVYEAEKAGYKNLELTVLEVEPRTLAQRSAPAAEALVFVVDSGDRERMAEARDQLLSVLELMDAAAPVLVFANKQDLPTAMPLPEIREQFSGSMPERSVRVQSGSATTGDGLFEGLDWVAAALAGPPSWLQRVGVVSHMQTPSRGRR